MTTATTASSITIGATEIRRARCGGHEGYRNGRRHLVDLARLINPRTDERWTVKGLLVTITADGPCPVCSAGWAPYGLFGQYGPGGKTQNYDSVLVEGTTTDKPCNASCMQSASAECKCSCGGEQHGMKA